ncbi:hypothetical protein CLOSTMETH_00808 [[Clostridium] methylpentosum DSM 5476]|uniref:Uncharacterized protein n=1 Tax=[Clostridium] methylpentosum DSM 5476 TaxID=537013 RepID=C0EAF3_9FIRM|nr:hypothetical protein CLOSTMETH_00808 [[Clostridium] methylpentosum DSM 5476]
MIFAFSLLYPQNSRCTRSSCSRIFISVCQRSSAGFCSYLFP